MSHSYIVTQGIDFVNKKYHPVKEWYYSHILFRLWRNPPCGYAALPPLCKGGVVFATALSPL